MKKLNLFSRMCSPRVGSRKDDGSTRYRLVIDSLSTRYRVWQVICSRMAAVFLLLLTLSIGNAWGTTGSYSLSGSQFGTSNVSNYSTSVTTLTGSNSSSWTVTGYGVVANTSLTIGKGGANYLKTPTCPDNITSVVVTWTGNASYYLALQTTSGTELEAKQNTTSSQTYTFTVSGSYKQLQLVGRRSSGTSNAAAVITSVTVNYGSSCTKIDAPSVTATPGNGTITLTWSNQTGASSYTVTKTPAGGTIGTPSKSGSTWTCEISGLTNGTAYTWSVEPVGSGDYCASGNTAASSSTTPNIYYSVTWKCAGSDDVITSVVSGQKPAFPSTPTSCDTGEGASTTFYGWATSTWSGKIDDISAKTIYTKASDMPIVSANGTVYHAVFCKGSGGSVTITNKMFTDALSASYSTVNITSGDYTFEVNACKQDSKCQMRDNATLSYIAIPTLPGVISRITATTVANGSGGSYSSILHFKHTKSRGNANTNDITKLDCSSSAITSLDWDVSGSNSTYKAGYLLTSGGLRLSDLTIYYGGSGTNYMTTCCSDPATALSITSGASVTLGNTLSLTSTGGNGGSVTWSVVNGTGTATVAGSTLTPATVGTVTVKAHQEATGGYCEQDAELEVTIVSSTVNVTGVTVDPTSKTIVVGETFTITPTIAPANATDKTIKSWTSSASGKASVTSAGVVTGVAAGTANITCTTNDGSKTATCAVTVYSATVTSIVDESGTSISGSGVSASISARNLTASEGTTNYKFKNWEFVGSSNGLSITSTTSLSTTLTGTPTGNVSLKAVFYKPVTIAWKVGTSDAAAGSQTLNAKRGTEWKDLTLPSAPADDALSACSNKFMGWTNGDELVGTGNSEPAVCLKSFSGVTTAIESPLTFRAVFATESAGGEAVNTVLFSEDFSGYSADNVPSGSVDNDHTGTTVYNGGSVTYSCTNGTKTSGSTAGGTTAVKNEALAEGTAPEIMVGKKGSGDGAVGGTFVISGIPNGGASELTVSYKQNANGLSATASGTSYSGSKTASTKAEQSFDVTVGSGTMTLTFQATSTSNVRLDNIEVKVKTRGVTYSNYVTKCCTQHTITLTGSGSVTGGTFASDPTSACEDVEVHLSATPDESHEFGSWTITNTSTGDDVTDEVTLVDNDFLMPDYGVTVTPTFNALTEYSVTWMVDGTAWSGKGGSTVVYQGRRISTLPTAPDYEDFCGDVFIGWTTVANYVHNSSPLYTKASDFPTASANQTFYAVFADFNE